MYIHERWVVFIKTIGVPHIFGRIPRRGRILINTAFCRARRLELVLDLALQVSGKFLVRQSRDDFV